MEGREQEIMREEGGGEGTGEKKEKRERENLTFSSCAAKKVFSEGVTISLLRHQTQAYVLRSSTSLATEAPTTQPYSPYTSHNAPKCASKIWEKYECVQRCAGLGGGVHLTV